MQEVLTRMPGPLRNEAILALVRVEGIPAALLQEPLRELEPTAPKAGEVLQAIFETQFESSGSSERENVRQALMVMARTPGLLDRTWLERAARSSNHQRAALGALGILRDPSYLPLLDELLRAGNANTAVLVADALTGYLSHEAGELLLVAATKLSGESRDAALAHLAKIREYQAAREEWATRRSSNATRAQVVAELVAKLDAKSEDVKVEAIRALATWEAVEAMPRLIELTQSGSKSVAAAARAALERLNAPKETTGG